MGIINIGKVRNIVGSIPAMVGQNSQPAQCVVFTQSSTLSYTHEYNMHLHLDIIHLELSGNERTRASSEISQ